MTEGILCSTPSDWSSRNLSTSQIYKTSNYANRKIKTAYQLYSTKQIIAAKKER